jgi:AbrB family looped-hinge helix DNA binding protein
MYTTIVSSRGQVVIPAEARKKLNIKEGDVLTVQIEEDGRIVMKTGRKERAKKGVVEKTAGLLADLEVSGLEYVEAMRRGSGRRLREFENSG